ncbi:phage tail assembly chaperone [Photorhabdus asymbiotica]|uniref:phage tail assembly chaperone n=1 Tax=Photorhabdus asymbiotica TaxID=291112 RepID=UPI003DA7292D
MEFEIDGKKYRTGKLNAFQQQDLAVALSPAIPALGPLMKKIVADRNDDSATRFEELLPYLIESITALGKSNRYEINDICLSVVSREQSGIWSKIYEPDGQVLMFDDINGLELLKIVGFIIRDSLGNFFPALLENEV